MSTENLIYLPLRAKIVALTLLIAALLFSAFVTAYYLFWVDVESTFVLAALSVFQVTSTGAAIAAVAFSSRSSLGREALLRETSRWLTSDFVESLETIDLPFDFDSAKWSSNKKLRDYTRVQVRVDHIEGTSSAFYEVLAFNSRMMMRVTLNSHRFIVLIYVDDVLGKETDDLREALELVIAGAEEVGFSTKIVNQSTHWAPEERIYELYFIMDVSKDLLYNGSERLYWAQDIATMVRSAIIQLKRNGFLSEFIASHRL